MSGKRPVAVVTGAARGIGRAVALGLADDHDLVLCDRLGAELATTAEEARRRARCDTSELDVRNQPAVAAWAERVAERFGGVAVLVNNVGGGFHSAFVDVSVNGQAALIAENFTQVADVTRAFVPLMASGASIVNITSIEAHRAGPGFAVYSAMKAAVENLTRSLALELGERGIRVNAVAPDMIRTPGDEELVAASGALSDEVFPTPLGRYGAVEDMVGPVKFLASPSAAFVTGQTLHVDGGTGAALGWRRRRADDTWVL